MKTYNTYQESKIANPDSKIYESIGGKFATESDVSHIALCGCNQGWNECKPSNYCMTVEEFLKAGYEFVEGDLIINSNGKVNVVGVIDTVEVFNKPYSSVDGVILVLRAAALEKPKRTKVEYVKVTESIFDLKDEFERGELYSKHKNKDKYYQVNTEMWLVSALNNINLYRRIETEIDERQEFIDVACDIAGLARQLSESVFGAIYDSGKFKLIEE